MESLNPSDLVERLGSDEDPVRKMAAFKLQGSIGDPSFAEIFISEGGLGKLRYLTLVTTGNTLAYSLTSFARLLEVDKGWDYVDEELVERVSILMVVRIVRIVYGIGIDNASDSLSHCHASPGQHPPRRHVNARLDRLASSQPEPTLGGWYIRVPRIEARNRKVSAVPGNAGQQAVLCRPCLVCERVAIDQFANARLDCQRRRK
jgi:hypothetical protein